MKINEICQKTGLTKKAVAYYQEKGLISPASQENGYREFTQEEAGRLGTIAFLRRLGLPVQEIALLLASPGDAGATKLVQARQEDRLALQKKQLELLKEVYRSKKWQPEDPETMTRKTKWTELLDCVFSENTDGIGVQDLSDECQRSVEDLVILQAESAELHQNIAKLSEHEQFIIKSIYFDGMKQIELAKKLGISKVRMSQKVSAILKKMRKMYEIG